MVEFLVFYKVSIWILTASVLAISILFCVWRRSLLTRYEKLKASELFFDSGMFSNKHLSEVPCPKGGECVLAPRFKEFRLSLQENEAYLRMLYDNILDPAFLVDYRTKRIIDSNQAARDFYGYTEEEFLEMTPLDLSLEKEETQKVLSRMGYVRVRRRKHCKKDGETVWVEVQQSYFERKKKRYHVLNLRDITEQVEIQEAFEKNYRRLVEAQEIAKIGNWEMHIETRRCWASDEAHRIFGHAPDEKGFVDIDDVIEHFENSNELMSSYRDFLIGKLDLLSFIHDIRAHDGTNRSIEMIVKLERDEHNRPLMLFGTVEDVTERVDMEKQLQADARREAFLARCLRLMLKSTNVNNTINQMISEIGSYFEADEVLVFKGNVEDKESVLSYLWGERGGFSKEQAARAGDKEIREWFGQLMQSPMVVQSVNQIENEAVRGVLKKDGVSSFLASPILIHQEMWGRISVEYFTQRRRLSQRDSLLLETLARIISLGIERSQREAALLDERNRAEEANQAKSDFLANMSHEIRTPMTAILGFADILANSDDEKEREDAVRTIRKNGKFLLDVINDILDFSKIEANRIDLEKQEVHLPTFISEIESLILVPAKEKELEFRLECPDPIPATIVSDPLRLKQILINLLGNAVKFTHKGFVALRVQYIHDTREEKKPRLKFQVSDSGIGISSEQIPLLFQPFTQADSSVTRRFGGTGLGLTISARLTEMLGGTIRVMSEEGAGSVFTFDIDPEPVGPSVSYQKVTVDISKEAIEWDATSLENINVLLVEDGIDNQRLVSLVLEKAGANVTIAENGQEACEKIEEAARSSREYDLVLMDMQMPVMDGYTATRKLRHTGYTMPIFALTAHALEHDRQRCIDVGCNDYISKPIQVNRLLSRIALCMEERFPRVEF